MEGLGGYFGRPAFLGAFVLAANGNSFQSMSCQHQIKVSNAWYIACCRHYESVGCRFQKVLAQGAEGGLSQLLAIYPHLLCRRPKQTRAAVLQSSCKGPCSQQLTVWHCFKVLRKNEVNKILVAHCQFAMRQDRLLRNSAFFFLQIPNYPFTHCIWQPGSCSSASSSGNSLHSSWCS